MNEIVTAICALAESTALYREELLKHNIPEHEAIKYVSAFIAAQMNSGKANKDD